jgi:hypothetical protein
MSLSSSEKVTLQVKRDGQNRNVDAEVMDTGIDLRPAWTRPDRER